MTATRGISPAKPPYRYLTRQLILSRDDRPFASEIRTTKEAHRSPPAASFQTTLAGQSCERSSDALVQALSPSSLKDRRPNTPKKYLNRTLLCVSEPGLASVALADELIRSGNNLRDLGHTLVVSLNEQPFWEVDSKYKKKHYL